MVQQQRGLCWTDERVPQTMIHQGSPSPATNRLPCSVSVELPPPWEALWLRLAVRCLVAEERGRRQIDRWLAEAVSVAAGEEAGWSSGLDVVMLSVLFEPSPEPSSTARRHRLLLESKDLA
jgi:hypothetical protein